MRLGRRLRTPDVQNFTLANLMLLQANLQIFCVLFCTKIRFFYICKIKHDNQPVTHTFPQKTTPLPPKKYTILEKQRPLRQKTTRPLAPTPPDFRAFPRRRRPEADVSSGTATVANVHRT